MLNAVLINDTRGHDHFGCHQVMDVIEGQLARRGIAVAARSLVRQKWWQNERFLAAMAKSDLVLINGEGTLHHGGRHGEELLRVAEHPQRGRIPVALVNALYQDNPSSWHRYLDRLDLISARDSRSAAELSVATGRNIANTLDFSLAGDAVPGQRVECRETVVISDSVDRNVSAALARMARGRNDALFVPIMSTLKGAQPQHSGVWYAARQIYIHAHAEVAKWRMRNVRFCSNLQQYLQVLAAARLHVTGRFHGICLSFATGTPFVGLTSNSWKIEALLDDIGFDRRRIMTEAEVLELLNDAARIDFSPAEEIKIEAARRRARCEVEAVFDALAGLATAYAADGGRANVAS